jgi:prepilin-type N-terminal cleavage/methylation domain-containing protein
MTLAKSNARPSQRGFSLLEMLFATVILLAGLVGVAQLVPTSILLDQKSRLNSNSLVFAQRELEQMLEQPLTSLSFVDSIGNTCDLGDPTQAGKVVGSPVVVIQNQPMIDFSPSSLVSGYNFTYTDPDDPQQVTYDVRWAVITYVNSNGLVTSKRIILGVRQSSPSGNTFVPPVTLDSVVER